MPGRTERRQTRQTPARERQGDPSTRSANRGWAAQEQLGRSRKARSTRPPSRERNPRSR